MNEQLINTLIKQAIVRVNNPVVNSDGEVICDQWEEGVILSNLIELTVRECVKRLKEEGNLAQIQAFVGSTYKYGYMYQAADILKQHFGIEQLATQTKQV